MRLFLLFAILLFAGCERGDEVVESGEITPDDTINFNIIPSDGTRGTIAEDGKSMESIAVFCGNSGVDEWVVDSKSFNRMYNTPLYFNEKEDSWDYEEGKEVTWNYETINDNYTFYSYSPYASDDNGITITTSDPATPKIKYSTPTNCLLQKDLLVAKPIKNRHPNRIEAVNLTYYHALTRVSFSINGATTKRISSIELHDIVNSGTLIFTDDSDIFKWSSSLTTSSFTVSVANNELLDSAPNTDSSTSTYITSEEGNLFLIPQTVTAGTEVTVVVTDENGSNSENVTLTFSENESWIAGKEYNYIITVTDELSSIDLDISQLSNCYMLHPSDNIDSYYIPIDQRINEFWGEYTSDCEAYKYCVTANSNVEARVLWCDTDSDIEKNNNFSVSIVRDGFTPKKLQRPISNYGGDFTNVGCELAMKVDIGSMVKGNVVVAAVINKNYLDLDYDIDKGSSYCDIDSNYAILWTWHLWITDYNPDVLYDLNNNLIVANGTDQKVMLTSDVGKLHGDMLHRYSGSVWKSGGIYAEKFIMDRNLGAFGNDFIGNGDTWEDDKNSAGVLYYQFGRKDPFPRVDPYDIFEIGESSIYLDQAVRHPTYFTPKNADWCTDDIINNTDALWFDPKFKQNCVDGKSIYDPSPLGWRVPTDGTWSNYGSKTFEYNSDSSSLYDCGFIYQEGVVDAYYAATGYLDYSSGKPDGSDFYGICWTSKPCSVGLGYCFAFRKGTINNDPTYKQTDNYVNTSGFTIRPVQE